MEGFLNEIIEGKRWELLIDTKIFPVDIVLKSAYNLLDRGYFFFKLNEDGNLILQFDAKEDVQEAPKDVIIAFSEELLNVSLRDKLEKDNRVIRETIVTAAISNSIDQKNFVELDTDNMGAGSEQNQIDFDKDIDEILKEIENDPDLKIDEAEIENILKEIEEESDSQPKPALSVDPNAVKDIKAQFNKNK